MIYTFAIIRRGYIMKKESGNDTPTRSENACKIKIIDSARKHYMNENLTDDDILHAVRNYIIKVLNFEDDPDKTLYIGTDISTRLLEVIVVENRNGEEVVIHAQKLTKKYIRYLENDYGND
jgi:hypothetical protein